MIQPKIAPHRIVFTVVALVALGTGVVLFFIPPALFPDAANGFNILRSMSHGSSFNILTAPDQSDISQNYEEFITWWSPGQYLAPWFLKLVSGLTLGQAASITVCLAQLAGLAGFYKFFKKLGFTPLVSALSLAFIVCQLAFFVPYIFYNGGEVLLFAFEGWFLYGCATLQKIDWKLLLFVFFSGWIGFFCKSSFLWIYAAGLFCLWVRVSTGEIIGWIKKGAWIGLPAALSLATIYILFLSKGQSPASVSKGLKVTAEAFAFPLSAPLLSGFSIDDFFHGLLYNFGKPMISHQWAVAIIVILAVLSLALVLSLLRKVTNKTYSLFLKVFYCGAMLFFGTVYLRQLNISYEARHFRIIGILIVPGMIFILGNLRPRYRIVFTTVVACIALYSINYLVKGFRINNILAARGPSGFAQINVDQASLNKILALDNQNRNATFVFIANDVGLEITHNRVIYLPPVPDDYKIDIDEYQYDGFAGPLFIVLPESYNGPKEKLVMKSFPGYTGFTLRMLSDKYVLYEARMKR